MGVDIKQKEFRLATEEKTSIVNGKVNKYTTVNLKMIESSESKTNVEKEQTIPEENKTENTNQIQETNETKTKEVKLKETKAKKEKKEDKQEEKNEIVKGGLVVGYKKTKKAEEIYFVDDNIHSLTVGATRSVKTRSVVLQTIGNLALAGESMILSDPKRRAV